jgi:hypothetical protein
MRLAVSARFPHCSFTGATPPAPIVGADRQCHSAPIVSAIRRRSSMPFGADRQCHSAPIVNAIRRRSSMPFGAKQRRRTSHDPYFEAFATKYGCIDFFLKHHRN